MPGQRHTQEVKLPHFDALATRKATLGDEEFPVFCARCGYRLKDVEEGGCPECGQAFTRTELLAAQYLDSGDVALAQEHRLGAWFRLLRVVACVGLGAGALLVLAGLLLRPHPDIAQHEEAIMQGDAPLFARVRFWRAFEHAALLGLLLPGWLAGVAAAMLWCILRRRRDRKRRRIIAALKGPWEDKLDELS